MSPNASDLIVHESDTLVYAMSMIEFNHARIVFVVNSGDQLIGVLTDGDIRRALIKGLSTSICVSEVCNRSVKYVKADDQCSKNSIKSKFNLYPDILCLPIVDQNLNPIDFVFREYA